MEFFFINFIYDDALCVACKNNNISLKIFKLLLNRKDIDLNHQNLKGENSLLIAIKHSKDYLFPLIFEDKRIDINIVDIEGRSILCPFYSEYDLFAQLVKRNDINLNVITNDGYTPLHYAVEYKDMDIFSYLLSTKKINIKWNYLTKDGSSFMHIAASVKSKQFINFFFKKGLDFNLQDNCGQTPLMVLIEQSGDINKIWNDVLKRKNLQINLKDKKGI